MLHLVKSLMKFTAIGTISLMAFTEMPVLAQPLMIQDGEVQLIAESGAVSGGCAALAVSGGGI
jgi:hypothetical protein